MASKKKKWKPGTRKRVNVGDIVQFKSPNQHMTGAMGTVVGQLNKHEILIRTMGGLDTDYFPMYVSIYDAEPNESYQDKNGDNEGHKLYYYGMWIQRVIFRVNPKPKKKRAPVRFHEVTHEELPAVLSGETQVPDGHKVVLVPSPAPALQAVQP